MAHRIYLTRIHHTFEADTYFPKLGHAWTVVKQERHEADEKNSYAYTFEVYERNPDYVG
jgi:dihydrofolate reductase